jgi:hypothetical protein
VLSVEQEYAHLSRSVATILACRPFHEARAMFWEIMRRNKLTKPWAARHSVRECPACSPASCPACGRELPVPRSWLRGWMPLTSVMSSSYPLFLHNPLIRSQF